MRGPSRPRPFGPKKVSSTRQIALPKELMVELGISSGDNVYLVAWNGRVLLVTEDALSVRLETLFTAGT